MTTVEALKNYYRDFGYWLHMCNDDEAEINFHTAGTPFFNSMDEAWAYHKELGDLIYREGIKQ
jgi:hypothetical protein